MKLLRAILQLGLLSSLTILIVTYSILQLVATGTGMSATLDRSGVYSLVAEQARASLASSPRIPAKYQAQFEASLEKTIDSKQVEAVLKPGIVDIATWLNQPSGTPAPDIIIVIKPAKDALIADISQKGLSALELAGIQAQLSQELPDQIRLSSLEDLVGDSSSTSSTGLGSSASSAPAASNKVIDTLTQVKSAVDTIRLVLFIAAAVSVLLTILIVWMSHRLGHSWTRAVASSYLAVGTFWLLASIIIPAVYRPSTLPVTSDTLQNNLIPLVTGKILSASFILALAFFLFGAIGVILSFLRRNRTAAPLRRIK